MKHIFNNFLRSIIGLLLALFLTSAYLFFYFKIETNMIHSEALAEELAAELSKESDLSKLKRTIDATNEDREKLVEHFVRAEDAVSFLETIESYGAIAGTKFQLNSADIQKDKNTMKLSFIANGTFPQVYRLLILIENTPYQFTMENISFSKVDPGPAQLSPTGEVLPEGEPKWDASFDITLTSFLSE